MTSTVSLEPRGSRGDPGTRPLVSFVLMLLLATIPICATAATISAIQGEAIPLGGTATGTDTVYLFLTGPNLPDQGISLVGGTPVVTGDPASFTRVEVRTDGTWAYTWETGSVGRVLDPSTYVLYVSQEPRSRPDLDDAVYAPQTITFGAPVETLAVTAPVTEGSLAVDSSPGLSDVTIDGRVAGVTPIVISGIPAGSHVVVISRPGYADYHANVTISPGARSEISATLQAIAPTTARTIEIPVSPSPEGLASPALVPIAAAALVILGFRHRR